MPTEEEVKTQLNLVKLEEETRSLKHRVSDLEEGQKSMTDLLVTVKELATNMTHMVDEQKRQSNCLEEQNARLDKLEKVPLTNYDKLRWIIVTAVCTLALGYIFNLILGKVS